MSDPVVVVFYDLSNIPLAGLTPSFASPGYYKTLAGVDASAPAVTDGGDGDYSFIPSATDISTGIRYLLDGGATAAPRFFEGVIDSAASAAEATTVSVTGVNLFGVTPTNLYTRHFPQWNGPTTDGNPSHATVLEIIDECAAELEARLLQESIDATALLVTNAAAYLWCRETLRLMAAIQVIAVATQQAPAVSVNWQKQLDARFESLDEKGYLALGGGVSAPSNQPDGPTHFIDHYSIDTTENAANYSGVTARMRRDDEL